MQEHDVVVIPFVADRADHRASAVRNRSGFRIVAGNVDVGQVELVSRGQGLIGRLVARANDPVGRRRDGRVVSGKARVGLRRVAADVVEKCHIHALRPPIGQTVARHPAKVVGNPLFGHAALDPGGMAKLVDPHVVIIELEGFFVAFQRGVAFDTVALHLDVQAAGDVVASGFLEVGFLLDQAVFAFANELADPRHAVSFRCEALGPDRYSEGMPNAESRLRHDGGSFCGYGIRVFRSP